MGRILRWLSLQLCQSLVNGCRFEDVDAKNDEEGHGH